MKDLLFALPGVALTIVCWGAYGTVLHEGQGNLGGNRLKPLICVGLAYFVIAIIVPCVILSMQGKLTGDWSGKGIFWSLMAGAAGAFGALGIVLALTAGGSPKWVMPLVFGGAPIINVLVATKRSEWANVSPVFYAGLIMVGVGAVTVLLTAPRKVKPEPHAAVTKPAENEPDSKPAKSGNPLIEAGTADTDSEADQKDSEAED